MTTALTLTAIATTLALVALVTYTQHRIYTRLDRMEQTQLADYDALHADTTLLRAQTARTLANHLGATLPDNPDNPDETPDETHTEPEHPGK